MIMEALIIEKKVFNNVILKVRLEPVSFLHYLLILIDTDADSVTIKKKYFNLKYTQWPSWLLLLLLILKFSPDKHW